MLTLAETGHQDIINKFGEEFEFRIGSSFKKKNLEVDTEEIDFTNEATIKLAESKETFEINYNEQNGAEYPLKLTGHLVEDRHNNNTYDPEAIKKCLMIFDEETNTWSLEIVKSSYHVNTGEFDNFETSNSASSDDSSSNDSSSENGNDKDDSDSGELTLNPEFVELASMMKTSLSQENGINNLNHTS
ncbi:15137_t:CDS:2 [Entrophospora sp. SA101]|nr:15137_t:CDS:2 [Entrophospora sp. SA101]CAJ0874430.1 17177_t:CDS:2 [Entrophospora sp. SA101]